MARRAATFTTAEVRRAIKAAKAEGAKHVEIVIEGGICRVIPMEEQRPSPARPLKVDHNPRIRL